MNYRFQSWSNFKLDSSSPAYQIKVNHCCNWTQTPMRTEGWQRGYRVMWLMKQGGEVNNSPHSLFLKSDHSKASWLTLCHQSTSSAVQVSAEFSRSSSLKNKSFQCFSFSFAFLFLFRMSCESLSLTTAQSLNKVQPVHLNLNSSFSNPNQGVCFDA